MTPNIDIVIPVRLTREFSVADECFKKCIHSLMETTRNYRIIFVDDNSDTVGQCIIESAAINFPNCLVVRTYKQRWFTRAVNLGLRLTNTPWVVTLNSDTFLCEGWLEELFAVRDTAMAESGKPIGLVGSVYSPEDPRRYFPTFSPHYVTGHCWLLNMNALQEVSKLRGTPGMFLDELNPLGIHIRSDIYICHDLNKLNYLTLVAHHSKVLHEAGKSWGHQLYRIPNSVDVVNDKY